MRKKAISFPAWAAALVLAPLALSLAQEKQRICEVTPKMRCLDKSVLEGKTIKVDGEATAISRDGLTICDSSYRYIASPDIILIMDNTGSMRKHHVEDGVARWCPNPANEPTDPGCISGDPDSLRGPALRTFLDSAEVKGGKGINVGVVLFSEIAETPFSALQPLNDTTLPTIKNSIVMTADGQTNYYAAFIAAQNLLKGSTKPKDQQFIVFVSDGRPNYPTGKQGGDPYLYKEDTAKVWNHLPPVHCIFLGDNKANYVDMQEIAQHTGGSFFNITDVSKLASYLTDSLSRTLFRTARPTVTTVRNLTVQPPISMTVGPDGHIKGADSTWGLHMQGPLYLAPGNNDILVQTEYGSGGIAQTVHFNIHRGTDGGPYAELSQESCRDKSSLVLYNGAQPPKAISLSGEPYLITDKAVSYVLNTDAPLDSLNVIVQVKSGTNAQSDVEVVVNRAANHKDSSWSNSLPFAHQQPNKKSSNGIAEADHGDTVLVTYQNPYIPEDSARAWVRVKYGVDIVSAAYFDLNGDGRIETVRIHFLDNLGTLPDSLMFAVVDARGSRTERVARGDEIAYDGDHDRLVVTLAKPFDYGVTSVANADSSGHTFRQDDVPLVAATFRVDDSVPPVIFSATVAAGAPGEGAQVDVIYSEPVNLGSPVIEPVVFRRDDVSFDAQQIPIASSVRLNDHEWVYHLAPSAEFSPVGGDSVAINDNSLTSDLSGTSPKHRTFANIVGGTPHQAVSDFFVTFANGKSDASSAGMEGNATDPGFIPVDSTGHALPGRDNGKCENCNPGQEGAFSGSVINVQAHEPVTYVLTIFSNLGDLVARARGKIEEADLRYLSKNSAGEYVQRIVWTGKTQDGRMAATGAYVLKADFHFDKSFRTGGDPSSSTKLTRFGFLRSCCATVDRYWYEDP